MVFSSLSFLFLFLPACLILYYASESARLRNAILATFSLIFYAWGEPIWVGLLLLTAASDYCNARVMDRFRGRVPARLAMALSLTVNLGLLASFKYSDFLVETINAALGAELSRPGLLLPIGISFYTFQSVSYAIDVYRGDVRAERSFLNFLVFLSSFHQLVAGPIVRYRDIAHELARRPFDESDFGSGVARFCQGLFKKVYFANAAGELSERFIGAGAGEMTVGGAWFGLLMFTLQIYFDFSGYSDMAIGLGRMFGFHYKENFNHPYVSQSVTEFWRRWHISLGTFFKDYIYVPLGGNRRFLFRNLVIVWGLTGLWHGASWNFVLWGLYFGVLLWLEKTLLKSVLPLVPRLLRHTYALLVVMVGWAIFRFTDLGDLVAFLRGLMDLEGRPLASFELELVFRENVYWLALALVMCTPAAAWLRGWVDGRIGADARAWLEVPANLGLLAVSVTLLVGGSYNPFLYFRF